jgi:hypothetical protein
MRILLYKLTQTVQHKLTMTMTFLNKHRCFYSNNT